MAQAGPVRRFKVLLTGPAHAGKTCLIKRFCERRFVAKYFPTIGVDYGVTDIAGGAGQLSLFDLAGKPEFAEVREEFYGENTRVAVLVFDVTARESLEALPAFLAEMRARASPEEMKAMLVVVCGNKADQAGAARAVSADEARRWADKHGFAYFDTSAANGEGVDQVFGHISDALMKT